MKATFFTTILFLLASVSALASPVDSLVQQLSKAQSSLNRLEVLEKLTDQNTDKDFEKVLKYGEEGLALARELKEYPRMVQIGKKVIKANLELNKYLENTTYFQEFYQLYQSSKIAPDDYARILYLEAHFCNLVQDFAALEVATSKMIDLQGEVSKNLQSKIEGFTYYFLSELAKSSKDYERAESFMLKKLQLNKEANDSMGLAAIYFDLAAFHIKFSQNYSKAVENAEMGLQIAQKIGWVYVSNSLYIARFHALVKQKDFNRAKNQMDTVQQLIAQTDRSVFKAQALLNVGEYYQGIEAYNEALNYLHEGLKQLKNNGENPLIKTFYQMLSDTYAALGDYENSYKFAKKETLLIDSIFQQEKVQAINYYQTKLDLVQEESKNESLNNQLNRQKLYFLIIFLAVLIGVYIIVQKIRTNRKLKTLNNQIARDTEKLSKAYESLEFFSRSIYHDISSRINLILGFSEFRMKRLKADTQKDFHEFVQLIYKNASFLKQFIFDIRTFSDMDSQDNPSTEVDLNRIISLVLETLGSKIYEKQAVLTVTDMPVIIAHESALMQLFQNLIENALKYVQEGQAPKIDISYTESETHFIINVQNNGTPIPENAAEHIFNPFYRLKRKGIMGSGLGLAICKRIVNYYNGDIWLKSSDQQQTVFSFQLPK